MAADDAERLSELDPTGRFTGLADLYAQYRPDYPAAAFDYVIERCGLTPGKTVVDVGAGTGISSRLLAERGLRVIAVEPNADMRRQAEAAPLPQGVPVPQYREGTGEATGLADASADAVLAAQSFHWFDAGRALTEFRRILRPQGWVVLIWNERDERDAFTAAYGTVVRNAPQGAVMEKARARAGQALLDAPLFRAATCEIFRHEQRLTEEQMIGRALSVSYAPREAEAIGGFSTALRDVFRRFQQAGTVLLVYQTFAYTAIS